MNQLAPFLSSLLLFACSSTFDNKLNTVDTPALSPDEIDDDGDGFTEIEGDCDDETPLINPDAEEICDGIDNDCNTLVDDNASDMSTFYLDEDNDGFGVNESLDACDEPDGYADNNDDCDDSTDAVNPEALEICDGLDNDCDAAIDDQDSGINPDLLTTFYADVDGDNYGDPDGNMELCEIAEGYVTNAQDCDDNEDTIHPDADEVCDGLDNNCNSLVDELDPDLIATELISWFIDADGDGYGDENTMVEQCSPPTGYVDNDSDCDDLQDETFPGAAELESTLDCMADADLDGYGDVTDSGCCYDIEMTDSYGDGWNGGAVELNIDGTFSSSFTNEDLDSALGTETQIDSFCISGGSSFTLEWNEGQYDYEVSFEVTDSSGTSILSESSPTVGSLYAGTCSASVGAVVSGIDCNDADADIFPGAVLEASATECMIDEDQDGYGDMDPGAGYDSGTDCDDNPLSGAATYPGSVTEASATECMLDSDGDGYGDIYPPAGYDLGSDCDDGNGFVFPGSVDEADPTECMIDLDGDGFGDEYPPAGYDAGTDCDDTDDDTYWGAAQNELSSGCMTDVDDDGYGDDSPSWGVDAGNDCDDTVFAVNAFATETWYDGVDQDCDGANDYDQDGDGFDSDAHGGTDCDDLVASTNPMALEDFTDGVDNNCDGSTDEDFALYEIADNVSLTYGQPLGITTNAYNDVFMVFHDGNGSIFYRKLNSDGTWDEEESIPAASGFSGEFLQTKVDGADQLQLAYTSFYSATDMYFNFMDTFTGSWSNDIFVSQIFAGSTFDNGFRIGFDIDSSNLPSFVFYDQDSDVPKMVRTSSSLSNTLSALSGTEMLLDNFLQTGCTLCYAGTYASMAIDSSDRAHAVFYNHSNVNWAGELFTDDAYENQYAYVNSGASSAECTDGNWVSDFNDTYVDADSEGIHNSVAMRPADDKPCVAYRDGDGDLLYACKDGGGCDSGWDVETVDSTAGDKDYAALAFNSNSEPYIAYYNANSGDLRLAHKSGGTWDVATLDNYGNVGNFAAIDIDSNDMVHVVYYDATNDAVKYAYGQ
jgi:hypothetical protein